MGTAAGKGYRLDVLLGSQEQLGLQVQVCAAVGHLRGSWPGTKHPPGVQHKPATELQRAAATAHSLTRVQRRGTVPAQMLRHHLRPGSKK